MAFYFGHFAEGNQGGICRMEGAAHQGSPLGGEAEKES
jgi:hypothetical protein